MLHHGALHRLRRDEHAAVDGLQRWRRGTAGQLRKARQAGPAARCGVVVGGGKLGVGGAGRAPQVRRHAGGALREEARRRRQTGDRRVHGRDVLGVNTGEGDGKVLDGPVQWRVQR